MGGRYLDWHFILHDAPVRYLGSSHAPTKLYWLLLQKKQQVSSSLPLANYSVGSGRHLLLQMWQNVVLACYLVQTLYTIRETSHISNAHPFIFEELTIQFSINVPNLRHTCSNVLHILLSHMCVPTHIWFTDIVNFCGNRCEEFLLFVCSGRARQLYALRLIEW